MGAADNFFQKAELALKKRNYEYSIELWQQGLAIDPDRVGERKKLRAAEIRRIQENGGNTMGGKGFKLRHAMTFGKIRTMAKKPEEQIVEIEKLLKTAPQNPDLVMQLATAFERTERYDCAIQSYKEIVEMDRSNVEALKFLGRLYETQKQDLDRAVHCWEMVREARPDDAEAGKAIRDLSAATMMRKTEERRSVGEGSYRDLLKDVDEATKLEQKAAIIRTDDDARTAIDLKQEEIAKDPENPRLIRELGDLYQKIKDFDKAQEAFEKAKAINPQDLYASEKIAILQERRLESAIEDARITCQNSPDAAAPKQKLEELLQKQNTFLLVDYERRVVDHPTDYGLKFKFGELLFKNGKYDEAIAQFQTSRKDPKYSTGSHYMIGKNFFAKKLFDLAIKEYGAAISSIPDADSDLGKTVTYDLAMAHIAKAETIRALELLEELMAVDINYRDVSKKVDEIRGM
ncbi:MAG: tetratricopeptide repeat protein [Planctomycetota bacterium]